MASAKTSRLRRNANLLLALDRVDATTRNALLGSAKKDLVATLVDCAKNILERRVPLTAEQTRNVRRLASEIRLLVNPRTSLNQRRLVLQTGGFASLLLKPVLKILPALLGGMLMRPIGGRRR